MSTLGKRGSTRAWRERRLAVLARDGYRCQVCGCSLTTHDPSAPTHATVDHVIGRAEWRASRLPGDVDDPSNLRACCLADNLARSAEQQRAARADRDGRPPLGASRFW